MPKTFSFFKADAEKAGAEFTSYPIMWFRASYGKERTYFCRFNDKPRVVIVEVPEDAHLETNRQLVLSNWLEDNRIQFVVTE